MLAATSTKTTSGTQGLGFGSLCNFAIRKCFGVIFMARFIFLLFLIRNQMEDTVFRIVVNQLQEKNNLVLKLETCLDETHQHFLYVLHVYCEAITSFYSICNIPR
jgi:hypothetical protein